MNCLERLSFYFGILKAGCIAMPLNFRYSSGEIQYCLGLADVEAFSLGSCPRPSGRSGNP